MNTAEQNINKTKDNVNAQLNVGLSQMSEAFKKIKEEVPATFNKIYTDAKNVGVYYDN